MGAPNARRKHQRSSAYRDMDAYRSNLAYDFNALERRRPEERPQPNPQIRTISRPKVSVRAAERVPVAALMGFAVAAVLLVLVLISYAQLTALSSSVVSLQGQVSVLETENVTLTTAYERAFDLETVESAATAAGMSKPSSSQIYYLDMTTPDSASVYEPGSGNVLESVFSVLGERVYAVVEYFT